MGSKLTILNDRPITKKVSSLIGYIHFILIGTSVKSARKQARIEAVIRIQGNARNCLIYHS